LARKFTKPTPLNDRQKEFLRQYLLTRNAQKSYIEAGYKSKNPDVDSSNLMKHPLIKEAIAKAEVEAHEKFEIKRERVLRGLIDIAEGSIGDIMDWDENGRVTLIPKKKMSERGIKFIDSIKIEHEVEKIENDAGGVDHKAFIKDIKITTIAKERTKALKLLGDHIGLWKVTNPEDDSDGAGPGTGSGDAKALLARVREIIRKPRE
jgi:hypothetical protein